MNIYSLNPALSLKNIIPEGIYSDSENFVLFLKAYYEWMHTSTFSVYDVSGTFVQGETLTGQTSAATAVVKQVNENEIIVSVSNSIPFERYETITGSTSSATAKINSITDNVLRQSANLINYRDLSLSIDKFSDYLKDELYAGVPSSYSGDKRFLGKKFRDFYKSKGQQQAYTFLMKVLYDQDVEIIYPGEEILKVSDGTYSRAQILRAEIIGDVGSNRIFDFLFKTIRGRTSNAIAKVTDIKKTNIGTFTVAEMQVSFVSGEFLPDEVIYDIDDLTPTPLETTLYGMVSGYTVSNGGSGYETGDYLTATGDGEEASLKISEIYTSGIDAIKINAVGYGYRLGTMASVNNATTGGSNLAIKVTGISNTYTVTSGANTYTLGEISRIDVVNRGEDYYSEPTIVLKDQTIYNLGLLTDKLITISASGNNYTVGDWLSFSSTYGAGANGVIASVVEANTDSNIFFEDGSTLISEQNYDTLKYEFWLGQGAISRVLLTNYGAGYAANNLPTVTINTSTGANGALIVTGLQGGSANIQVDTANNYGGIGSIKLIEPVNLGVNFTSANVDATLLGNGDAVITPIISGIATTTGIYTSDRGKLDYGKIQDSYYYQDYSYVIKSGIELTKYKNVLKKLIHPIGLEVFGEISIVNNINLSMGSDSVVTLDAVSTIITTIVNNLEVTMTKVVDFIVDPLYAYYQYVPIDDKPGFSNSIANSYISAYQFFNFNSQYGESIYYEVVKNTPIPGTVSFEYSNKTVIGSGTTFTEYFSSGNDIIIDNNRLKVDTVYGDTLLTVVVSPTNGAVISGANAYYIGLP